LHRVISLNPPEIRGSPPGFGDQENDLRGMAFTWRRAIPVVTPWGVTMPTSQTYCV